KCQGLIIRYFPLLKIIITYISLLFTLRRDNSTSNTHALAHTMWSDGCVAYLWHLTTRRPYSICIRSTDINWFIPKLPHYRWLMRLIIAHADSVIFISAAHKRKLQYSYSNLFSSAKSTYVIPNGIDRFWLDNRLSSNFSPRNKNVLFVGAFNKNKN